MKITTRWEALVLACLGFCAGTAALFAQSTTPTGAPVITGPSTISGPVGTPLDVAITATNGPREYAVRGGSLPPGINFDMMAGRFVGSPTTAGSYRLDIAAANYGTSGAQWSSNFTVSFSIAAGTPTTTTPAQVTGPSSVSGVVGRALSATLSATRAVLYYRIHSGTIPPGLGFDMSGVIRGTPTQAGTFTLAVIAVSQGSSGQQESSPYSITIGIAASDTTTPPPAERPSPVITGPSSASGEVGRAFSLTFTATNEPTSYHIEFGAAPPGTAFDGTAGTIRGTPTQAGTFRLDVIAHNLSNGVAQSSPRFSVTITIATATTTTTTTTPPATTSPTPTGTTTSTPPPQPVPRVTGPFAGSGRRGEPFSLVVSASNNPAYFQIRSGITPQGLIVDTAGSLVFRGTPTQVGTYTLSVAAANNGPSGPQWSDPATVTITIAEGDGPPTPVITGPFIATGTVGQTFSMTFTATNSPLAYGISTGSLPPGIRIDYFGGILSGTPTEAGTFRFNVIAENSGSNGTRQWSAPAAVTITINPATSPPTPPPPPPPVSPSAPVISGPTDFSGQTGQAFSATLTATNNAIQFALRSGTLPPSLALDGATGRISGTPQLTGTATVSVAAANAGPNGLVWGAPANIRITITSGPAAGVPVISGPATATGTVGQLFSLNFTTTNQPREYAVRSGSLPPGLHFDLMAGAIVGTPTAVGAYRFEVAAGNQGTTGTQWSGPFTIIITIAPATVVTLPGGPTVPPTPTTPPVAITGTPGPGTPTPSTSTTGATTPLPPTGITNTPTPGLAGIATTPTSAPVTATTSTSSTPPGSAATGTGSSRAPQTMTVSAPLVMQPNDAPVSIVATTSAGLPVKVEVVSGPAVVSNDIVSLTGQTGVVSVRASQPGTNEVEPVEVIRTFMVAPANSSQLANISARVEVSETDPARTFITGFVVGGTTPRRVLLRASGPALGSFGVNQPVADPELKVVDSTGRTVAENDNWQEGDVSRVAQSVGAFPLQPGAADAAIVVDLPPGNYSMQVTPKGGTGIALAEVFHAGDGNSGAAMINMSTRGFVGRNDAQLTTGFVIGGTAPKRVLVRAAGPALAGFGVTDALVDPVLTLHRGSTQLAQNDDWTARATTAGAQATGSSEDVVAATRTVGAFTLPPGSKDSAMVLDLPPGAYTATVSGAGSTTGSALIEVYEVAPAR